MTVGPDRPGRTVTSKILAILSAFELPQPSLSLTQIADVADLPLPTAHRLVGELVQWGALTRQANGNYTVGLRLWAVGENSLRMARAEAKLHLQDLFALTHETAQLAVRSGFDALYLERVYSSRRAPRSMRVGSRVPLHLTSVGKVLLAHEPQAFIDDYLAAPLESRTRYSHAHPGRLRAELAQIRSRGYATSLEELRLGSCSIAVRVTPLHGLMPAAVGIVAKSTQADSLLAHVPALQGTAARLGQLSGP